MASADDDDFDWGSRECTPSENNVCGEPCDFYDAYATCPSHVSRAGKKKKNYRVAVICCAPVRHTAVTTTLIATF